MYLLYSLVKSKEINNQNIRTYATPSYSQFQHSSAQSSQPLSIHSHQHNQAQEYHTDRHGRVLQRCQLLGGATFRRCRR